MKNLISKRVHHLLFFICLCFSNLFSLAQFSDKGVIEFEVRTNIKKTMGNSDWAESMKDKLPDFKVSYFNYSFAGNKSIFQFDRWEKKEAIPDFLRQTDEKSVWYGDFGQGKFKMKKELFGSVFNVNDSFPTIKWKVTNESRIIAGYNCRKAVGIMMDSVYVFAFYTEELLITGGPCTVNGLPGMILGMTIPRLYTSWMATKVDIDKSPVIAEPATGKNIFNLASTQSTIIDKTKGWMGGDDAESKKWLNQLIWNILL